MYRSVWTWDRVADAIRGLRGRLGFPDSDAIEILGLRLDLETGELYDVYLARTRQDLAPNVYFVLYKYAVAGREIEETERLIGFQQLYGGDLYYRAYRSQVIEPLSREVGSDRKVLAEVCSILGGERAEIEGYDLAVKLRPLPLVPVYVALDLGGGEFEPEVSLFYDESIKEMFTAEDVYHLADVLASRISELVRELRR
ncbi:hypothetical protein B6U99_01935 [Candidatus Geothermarchaeota archaeon ex4572_27]|nr:MAG: hypothetical protein B6U99_01935 [Candidatus Geothermarchaeota archaeon ex4572_27]